MTPQQEYKRVQRALRTIPVEAVAPYIAAEESNGRGLWCLVDGELEFVRVDGGGSITTWDDFMLAAQYVRWVQAHPELVHDTKEAAVAFVQAKLGRGEQEEGGG